MVLEHSGMEAFLRGSILFAILTRHSLQNSVKVFHTFASPRSRLIGYPEGWDVLASPL